MIPASVREIGTEAFCNCAKLRTLTLQQFWTGNIGCVSQEKSNLRSIGARAFYGCAGLTRAYLPEGLEEIGLYAFSECGLECITVPSSVRVVRQGAFCRCQNLTSAWLSEGLEILGTVDQPTE